MRLILPILLFVYGFSGVLTNKATADAVIEALIDESLKSHRVQACDGEKVVLHCPRNTHIMVETGFYGRVVPPSQLCPLRRPSAISSSMICDVIHAQSKLSEICDKKRKCSIHVDSSTFEDDPCIGTSKYLQMSYKCKPISFDGESFCEGSEMQLECREGRRLAIYSAVYGSTRHGQATHCTTSVQTLKKDCTRDVLPQVLPLCHARESCSLSVSDRLFGNPCGGGVDKYLHIMFMCVNEEIFSEDAIKGETEIIKKHFKYFEGSGDDFSDADNNDKDTMSYQNDKNMGPWTTTSTTTTSTTAPPLVNAVYRKGTVIKETDANPKEPIREELVEETVLPVINNDEEYLNEDASSSISRPPPEEETGPNLVGVAYDLALVGRFMKDNQEKVLICVAVSCSFALLILLIACVCNQFSSKPKKDPRVRYSIERSTLIARSNQMLNGPNHLVDISDISDQTLLRYSLSSPPRSSHYDF